MGDDTIRTTSGLISKRSVKLLNQLTNDTGASMVITSTWRKDETGLHGVKSSLRQADITGPIIGATGVGCRTCLRGNEIRQWMIDNKNLIEYDYHDFHTYAILDDDSDILLWQAANYVRVDPWVGLTPNTVHRAERLLR